MLHRMRDTPLLTTTTARLTRDSDDEDDGCNRWLDSTTWCILEGEGEGKETSISRDESAAAERSAAAT